MAIQGGHGALNRNDLAWRIWVGWIYFSQAIIPIIENIKASFKKVLQ